VIARRRLTNWHHTSDEEGIDRNFAVFQSFIDQTFGTAYLPDHWPQRYSTVRSEPPATFPSQLAYPFRANTPYR